MANGNNETTTRFNVDISELKKAMQDAKRQIQVANSEFKAVSSSMDDWSKSTDGLQAKLKQLDNNLKSQKTILRSLESQYEAVVREQGEGSAAADRLKIAINNQRATINSTEREIGTYTHALDELGDEAEDAGEKAKKSGDGFSVMKGALANLVADGIKAAISGVVELGKATVNMVKQSVESYAEYEQLVGGIDTLFKDSNKKVMEYANNAYKTAGMSANAYMETVTGFSASLLQSLGGDTDKAAEVANMALIDMADNANKMGTSMDMIQNAYGGFAKQNYTMLDNLKLGYGGTQEEMKRLLADAEKFSGQKYDISNLNDVYQAIHVVQTELGITGTTAKEASSTISGSVASMKSAWQNLVVGMADPNANFGQLVTNVVDSATTAIGNIIPVATQAIGGLGQLIQGLAPVIAEQLPALIDQVVPTLLTSLSTLLQAVVNSIMESLPTLTQTLMDVLLAVIASLLGMLPQLTTTLSQMIVVLIQAIGQALPQIVTSIIAVVPQIISALMTQIPVFIDACITFLMSLVDAIPTVIQAIIKAMPKVVNTVINGVTNGVDKLLNGAVKLLTSIVNAIPKFLPSLVNALPTILSTILKAVLNAVPQLLQAAITLLMAIVNAIPQIVVALANALPQIITTLITTLTNNAPLILKTAVQVFLAIVKAIPQVVASLAQSIPTIIRAIVNGLKAGISQVRDIGRNLVEGLWNGIKDMTSWIADKIRGFGDSVVSGLKDFFGIHSPSKLMEKEIGRFLPEGIAVGIDKNAKSVLNSMRNLTANTLGAATQGLQTASTTTGGVLGGTVNNFYQTINSPKQLSRLDIYRQSKNLLGYAGGGL